MTEQLDLFTAPVTRGASRRNDPWTSKAAARSMSGAALSSQQQLVLSAVTDAAKRLDLNCASAYEVTRWLGVRSPQQSVVARRLTELLDRGFVEDTGVARPGSSGRLCRCYRVTPAGNRWLVGEVA